jgi:hypothetical protein
MMHTTHPHRPYQPATPRLLGAACLGACCALPAAAQGISPQTMTDALHAVMAADRTVYTKLIVNRLQNDEKILKASEHWKDEKALVLPAQMFRYGAEEVAKTNKSFSYSLLSLWPINKQNAPRTPVEKEGLQYVADNPAKAFYKEEELGGRKYFTAVYADRAIAPACVSCHNDHKDTPRSDFKMGMTMGGVVIRVPVQ